MAATLPDLTNAEIVLASPLLIADYVAKANSGTTTTLQCQALKGLDEDQVIGAYICFLNDGNYGVDRIITDYVSTNVGTFTFDALPTAVNNTVTFAIVFLDYTGGVIRAKMIIEDDLKRKGLLLENLLNADTQLKELVITKTLSHICKAKRQDADDQDMYHINYLEFEADYQKQLATLVADYDTNEDGTISDNETDSKFNQVEFVR